MLNNESTAIAVTVADSKPETEPLCNLTPCKNGGVLSQVSHHLSYCCVPSIPWLDVLNEQAAQIMMPLTIH